jgi:hypothetical protein
MIVEIEFNLQSVYYDYGMVRDKGLEPLTSRS